MDASFFCSKPPMPTLRSSIPIRTTTAQHKNVKICFYITTEKEKPERGGGAAPAAAAIFFPTAGRPRFIVSGEAPFNSLQREFLLPLLDRFWSSPGRFPFRRSSRRSSIATVAGHRRPTSSPPLPSYTWPVSFAAPLGSWYARAAGLHSPPGRLPPPSRRGVARAGSTQRAGHERERRGRGGQAAEQGRR